MAASPPSARLREVEASVGQRLLWLLEHYRGGGSRMSVPLAWRVRGPLDEAALRTALSELEERHEALRTTYASRGRRLVMLIHAPRPVPVAVVDVSDDERPAEAALSQMHAEIRTEIDAAAWPVAVTLWRIADDDHLLLVNVHHLATDFFSNMVLSRDLSLLYDRAIGATAESLPPVACSYADWAERQRRAFADGRLDQLRAFWKEALAGARPVPLEALGPTSGGGGQATHDLEPRVVEALRDVARRSRTTMFSTMLAAFYAYLHGRSGQRDIAVASVFTNRLRPDVQETVGFFVNMLVLRARVDPDAPFTQLVRDTRTTLMRALSHADLPYQMLPAGTLSAPADDIVFQYVEAPEDRRGALDVEVLDLTVDSGRFALELTVYKQRHLMVTLGDAFDAAWGRDFLAGYARVLAAVAQAPEARTAQVSG